jgi:hypothetical protein
MHARLRTLLCKKITVPKSKGVTTGCNVTESSKEGYGSKRAVLPMMMKNSSSNIINTFYFLIYTIWEQAIA